MKYLIVIAIAILSFSKMNAQSGVQYTQKKGTYALVVSFISKGSGIDGKTMDKINAFVKSFPKKPAFEVCQMGKEGETTLLFHLKELSKHEQKKFIKELRELILDKEMVLVEENKLFESRCRG